MTVLHTEMIRVDDGGGRWLRPVQLQKKFSLGRTTIYRLLEKMREKPKYKEDFLELSKTLKLVREQAFLEFLKGQDRAYLKE